MANDGVRTEPDRVLRWVEQVAAFCVGEGGLPPITGRILGWLMICEPAEQSAGQIAGTIQASRASLTSNMRHLLGIGLVRRIRRPGERTAYYRIEEDAWQKVVRRRLDGLTTFGEIADEGLAILGPDGPRSERVRAARETMAWLLEITQTMPR